MGRRRGYSNGRIYKRGGVWWASLYIDGVGVRRRGGRTEAEADLVLRDLRLLRDRGAEAGAGAVRLDYVLNLYRRNLATRGKPRSLRTWDLATRTLKTHFGDGYDGTAVGKPLEPLRYRDLYKPVRQSFQRAKLWSKEAKSGLHMLRRSFASRMLTSGVDLATLKELGGWSTIEACQRYLTSTTQRKRDAVATLDF